MLTKVQKAVASVREVSGGTARTVSKGVRAESIYKT
jgi:hypothetical protein